MVHSSSILSPGTVPWGYV